MTGFMAFTVVTKPPLKKLMGVNIKRRGMVSERWGPIRLGGKVRGVEQKAIKPGSEQERLLDETERTIRFGLFTLTLMFFRSLYLVGHEKKSRSGSGAKTDDGVENGNAQR